MLKLLVKLPRQLTVALSGGVDSVAVVDFLAKSHVVKCAFFHHGTENSERAAQFVAEFCQARGLQLITGRINAERSAGTSPEEHWRNERYAFLESIAGTVVTAHNLDDSVETYVHSALHGRAKVIPVTRNNIVRPFLTTPKAEFVSWCRRKNIAWCEDASNRDVSYMRNYIRHELMPHALRVNPGLSRVVARIIENKISVENG